LAENLSSVHANPAVNGAAVVVVVVDVVVVVVDVVVVDDVAVVVPLVVVVGVEVGVVVVVGVEVGVEEVVGVVVVVGVLVGVVVLVGVLVGVVVVVGVLVRVVIGVDVAVVVRTPQVKSPLLTSSIATFSNAVPRSHASSGSCCCCTAIISAPAACLPRKTQLQPSVLPKSKQVSKAPPFFSTHCGKIGLGAFRKGFILPVYLCRLSRWLRAVSVALQSLPAAVRISITSLPFAHSKGVEVAATPMVSCGFHSWHS
jgi:hypothetical protein